MSQVIVLGASGPMFRTHEAKAAKLVATNRARWTRDHRAIHLNDEPGEPGHGRTRTARGGILGVIGRGQQYTLQNRQGIVVGFKRIYPEDRPAFNLATIEACKAS